MVPKITLMAIPLAALILPSCGYGPAGRIHPRAAAQYVRAVMLRTSGHPSEALPYYNDAVGYTDSPSVRAEMSDAARGLSPPEIPSAPDPAPVP